MKIFLDDKRLPPEGWVLARWPSEVIYELIHHNVSEISLDHDLGNDDKGTGYDVILWIEKAIVVNNFVPPKIKVHSANISARKKMEAGIESIKKILRNKRS